MYGQEQCIISRSKTVNTWIVTLVLSTSCNLPSINVWWFLHLHCVSSRKMKAWDKNIFTLLDAGAIAQFFSNICIILLSWHFKLHVMIVMHKHIDGISISFIRSNKTIMNQWRLKLAFSYQCLSHAVISSILNLTMHHIHYAILVLHHVFKLNVCAIN